MQLISDEPGYKVLLGRLETIIDDSILKGAACSFPDLRAWMIHEGAPVFSRITLTPRGDIVSGETSNEPPHWFLGYTAEIEQGDGWVTITQVPWPTPKYVFFTSTAEEVLVKPDAIAGDKALIVASDGGLTAYTLKAHPLAVMQHDTFLRSLYRQQGIEDVVKRGEKLGIWVKPYPIQPAVLHVIDNAFSEQAEALKWAVYKEFGHMPTVMSDPGFQFTGSVEIPPLCAETSTHGKFAVEQRVTVRVPATYVIRPINAASIKEHSDAAKAALSERGWNLLPERGRELHPFPY